MRFLLALALLCGSVLVAHSQTITNPGSKHCLTLTSAQTGTGASTLAFNADAVNFPASATVSYSATGAGTVATVEIIHSSDGGANWSVTKGSPETLTVGTLSYDEQSITPPQGAYGTFVTAISGGGSVTTTFCVGSHK